MYLNLHVLQQHSETGKNSVTKEVKKITYVQDLVKRAR